MNAVMHKQLNHKRPLVRAGYVELHVDVAPKRLSVSVKPEAESKRPGEKGASWDRSLERPRVQLPPSG